MEKKRKKTYENGTLGGKDQKEEERRKKKMTPRDPLRDLKIISLDENSWKNNEK